MQETLPMYNLLTPSQKFILAQKLGTVKGFYMFYFDKLPYYSTQTDCFNALNLLHYNIFNEYKYEDYNSFRRSLKYHLNKNKR